jgi:hypothetical protein
VMMDLTTERGAHAVADQHGVQIMRHAMARFDIAVSSVYWRLENASAHQQPDLWRPRSGSVQRLCTKPSRLTNWLRS